MDAPQGPAQAAGSEEHEPADARVIKDILASMVSRARMQRPFGIVQSFIRKHTTKRDRFILCTRSEVPLTRIHSLDQGVHEYEPGVIKTLLSFVYRYTEDLKGAARVRGVPLLPPAVHSSLMRYHRCGKPFLRPWVV